MVVTAEILERFPLPVELSVSAVKEYLRVYDTEHDSVVEALVEAAVEFVQHYTRQQFRRTQYRAVWRSEVPELMRFPVLSIDSVETTVGGSYAAVSAGQLAGYRWSEDMPPQLEHSDGQVLVVGEYPIRVTWTAGIDDGVDWPRDLVVVIWQMVEENFRRRGASPDSAQAAQFSRSFALALEQYAFHYDAVR